MNTFEAFVMRHGEPAAQAILENWERFAGIRKNLSEPLECRWQAFMQNSSMMQHQSAAA